MKSFVIYTLIASQLLLPFHVSAGEFNFFPAKNDEIEKKDISQHVIQTAQIVADNNNKKSDAFESYAKGLAASYLNTSISNWLNQYGTARVNTDFENNTEIDFLFPLKDSEKSILFSQTGYRFNSERSILNMGLGYRHYFKDQMLGVNTFYDRDLTGSNDRLGLGVEWWADYIKLAANGYLRLSDWQQSSLNQMKDFDERPANGFDIRAEGYLPHYPQLGSFLRYEKYYGDNVNLNNSISINNLKKDPSRSSMGLTYTPIPLLTLNAQTYSGDQKDSSFGLELKYRFGVPFRHQVNPQNVNMIRTLAGNRYDFIDRNNNIVMQYKKQELLSISLPEQVTVEEQDLIAVSATVNNSKYGVQEIIWTAPELVADGGRIDITSNISMNLTAPLGTSNDGKYLVTAVAIDTQGNRSNVAQMSVNVISAQEEISSFTVAAETDAIPKSNHTDRYRAVATVKNSNGLLLKGQDVNFSVNGFSDNTDLTLSNKNTESSQTITAKTDSNGQAIIFVKSKLIGEGVIIATTSNSHSSAPIKFVADSTSAEITSMEVIKNDAKADGEDEGTILLTVKDHFKNPVTNFPITFDHDEGVKIVGKGPFITDQNGQLTVSFTSTVAGNARITANGENTKKSTSINFKSDASLTQISSVTLNSTETEKVIGDSFVYTVTVVDALNKPLSGQAVTANVTSPITGLTTDVSGLTDESGQAKITLMSTTAATDVVVVAQLSGSTTMVRADKPVSFIAQPMISSVALNDNIAEKIVGDSFVYTVTVVDALNKPLSGQKVTANVTSPITGLTTDVSGLTDESGQAKITLMSTTAATDVVVVAQLSGSTTMVRADKPVSFIANSSVGEIFFEWLSSSDLIVANNVDINYIKATVRDSLNNPVLNTQVKVELPLGVSIANGNSLIFTTDNKGAINLELVSTKFGSSNILATVIESNNTSSLTVNFSPSELNLVAKIN